MATIDTFEVYQGDTTKVKRIQAEGYPVDTDWSAKLTVLDQGKTEVFSKDLLDIEDGRFRIYLTPAETEAIEVGSYTMGVQLKNLTLSPPFVREVHYELIILDQIVS